MRADYGPCTADETDDIFDCDCGFVTEETKQRWREADAIIAARQQARNEADDVPR